MFIDQITQKRVNIYAPYAGRSKLDTPEIRAELGIVEILDPTPPEDYSDETYYRTESDDAPYVIYTKKSEEQLDQLHNAKVKAQITAIEGSQARAVREAALGQPQFLQSLEAQIQALRASFKPELVQP